MYPDLSIIISFLNEEENIEPLCKCLEIFASQKEYNIEVVFVDDGSTDRSIEVLENQKISNFTIKLVKLSRNFGSHAATRAGLLNASAPVCVFMGADMQEPLSMVSEMYEKILEGHDLVCAQKREVNVSGFARITSSIYSKAIRRFAIPYYPQKGVNNVMFNNKIKDHLNTHIEANSSIILQIINLGFKCAIIDVDYAARTKGQSKWVLSKKIKMFIDSFVAFSFAPIRFVSILGIVFAIIGFIVALHTLVVKIFNIFPYQAGWPTLISIILIGFGLTNLSLGIIAEYLWRTLDASRNRPVFIVDEVVSPQSLYQRKSE